MIISHQHKLVFFHNPKAGGTSVREAIAPYNDIGFALWGVDSSQTGGIAIDRAHLGIDEFSKFYPRLWHQISNYKLLCTYRDPLARFLSSVSEYSKNFADEDIRFCPPENARAFVINVVDRLSAKDAPDQVMRDPTLTHFKPQHIYWASAYHPVRVHAFPISGIDRLFAELSTITHSDIHPRHRKIAKTYDLPYPIAWIARYRRFWRAINKTPGARWIGSAVKRKYASGEGRRLALTADDQIRIEAFVRQFYAKDFITPSAPKLTGLP